MHGAAAGSWRSRVPTVAETVFVAAVCGVLVLLLPALWSACDGRAARVRLLPVSPGPHAAAVHTTDGTVFLRQVARAVQAGAGTVQAIVSAPASSSAVAAAQQMLRSGAPLGTALRSDDPDLRTLATCIHHGTVSVPAVEHALESMRRERELSAGIRAGSAAARRSARVLTSVPFVLLALGAAASASVRSVLGTPAVMLAVVVGAGLNRAGLAWMTSTANGIAAAHESSARPGRIAAAVAAHLRAGGTLVSAFDRLSAWDHDCAQVSTRLAAGDPLPHALAPLSSAVPALVDALVSGTADGLPLVPAVDTVVRDLAAARAAIADEQLAELPVRGTAPLVLLVLPSFLLLSVAPIALDALRGLSTPPL